jgi:hypothetical protein
MTSGWANWFAAARNGERQALGVIATGFDTKLSGLDDACGGTIGTGTNGGVKRGKRQVALIVRPGKPFGRNPANAFAAGNVDFVASGGVSCGESLRRGCSGKVVKGIHGVDLRDRRPRLSRPPTRHGKAAALSLSGPLVVSTVYVETTVAAASAGTTLRSFEELRSGACIIAGGYWSVGIVGQRLRDLYEKSCGWPNLSSVRLTLRGSFSAAMPWNDAARSAVTSNTNEGGRTPYRPRNRSPIAQRRR